RWNMVAALSPASAGARPVLGASGRDLSAEPIVLRLTKPTAVTGASLWSGRVRALHHAGSGHRGAGRRRGPGHRAATGRRAGPDPGDPGRHLRLRWGPHAGRGLLGRGRPMTGLISSAANPVVKRMPRLGDRKHRRREGAFVVEGIQPVWQAVEAGADVELLVVAPALLGGSPAAEMVAGQEAAGTRVARVTGELFARLSARDGPS